jgi:hypothetical protein
LPPANFKNGDAAKGTFNGALEICISLSGHPHNFINALILATPTLFVDSKNHGSNRISKFSDRTMKGEQFRQAVNLPTIVLACRSNATFPTRCKPSPNRIRISMQFFQAKKAQLAGTSFQLTDS